jgi:hypothetical protein
MVPTVPLSLFTIQLKFVHHEGREDLTLSFESSFEIVYLTQTNPKK